MLPSSTGTVRLRLRRRPSARLRSAPGSAAAPRSRAATPCRRSVPSPRRRGLAGHLYLFTIRSVFFLSGARLQLIAWPKGCGPRGSLTDAEPPRTDARPAPTLSALRWGTRSRGRARQERGRLAPHPPPPPHADWRRAPAHPYLYPPAQPTARRRGGARRGARPLPMRPVLPALALYERWPRAAPRRAAHLRVGRFRPPSSPGSARTRGPLVWLGARGALFCSPAIREPLLRSVLCVAALSAGAVLIRKLRKPPLSVGLDGCRGSAGRRCPDLEVPSSNGTFFFVFRRSRYAPKYVFPILPVFAVISFMKNKLSAVSQVASLRA